MKRGIFVTYWPCGVCIAGASVDDDDREIEFSSSMLVEAVREGRRVGYWKPGDDGEQPIRWACRCSPVPTDQG